MPTWSECRHTVANNMDALDASPYLAISTIDAAALGISKAWNEPERDKRRPPRTAGLS
jgi:hypothetical protein